MRLLDLPDDRRFLVDAGQEAEERGCRMRPAVGDVPAARLERQAAGRWSLFTGPGELIFTPMVWRLIERRKQALGR